MKNNILSMIAIATLISMSSVSFSQTGACYIKLSYYGQRNIPGLWGNNAKVREQTRCFSGLTREECVRRVKHFEYLNRAAESHLLSLGYDWLKGEPCSDTFFNN